MARLQTMEVPEVYMDEEWDNPPYNITSTQMRCLPFTNYTRACMATCCYHVSKAIESYNCIVE